MRIDFFMLRTIVGYSLIVLGGYVSLLNWTAPIISKRSGRNVSTVPFFGAGFLGLGIFLLTESLWWSLIAIPLDLGTLFLPFGVAAIILDAWKHSRGRRVQRLKTRDRAREIQIDLYKNSAATIVFSFDARNASHDQPFLTKASWTAQWKETGDGIELYDFADGGSLVLQSNGNNYHSVETSTRQSDARYKLDGLQFDIEKN
jgi:hypothetical protein